MMNAILNRFLTRRNLVILFMALVVALFFHLRESGISGKADRDTYDYYQLVSDPSCKITKETCAARFRDVALTLAFNGKPDALKPFQAVLTASGIQAEEPPVVSLVFNMKGMNMGELKQKLRSTGAKNTWAGQVILPVCSTGRRDWRVRVDFIMKGKIYSADFDFELN